MTEEHTHHPNYVKIWAVLLVLLIVSVIGPMFGIRVVTLITAVFWERSPESTLFSPGVISMVMDSWISSVLTVVEITLLGILITELVRLRPGRGPALFLYG